MLFVDQKKCKDTKKKQKIFALGGSGQNKEFFHLFIYSLKNFLAKTKNDWGKKQKKHTQETCKKCKFYQNWNTEKKTKTCLCFSPPLPFRPMFAHFWHILAPSKVKKKNSCRPVIQAAGKKYHSSMGGRRSEAGKRLLAGGKLLACWCPGDGGPFSLNDPLSTTHKEKKQPSKQSS